MGSGSVDHRLGHPRQTAFRLALWTTIAVGNCITCILAFLVVLEYGFVSIAIFAFLIGAAWIAYSVSRIQSIRHSSISDEHVA